jgi:predicted acetyltransferase
MDIELRNMGSDGARHFLEVVEAAFGAGLTDEVYDDLRHVVETDRALGAFDGEVMVGTAAAYSLRFTVPGGEVDGAGVTMVGVLPSHRRRGVMRRMMTSQLRDVRERGERIATLWASEDTIYGRFGYGAASVQGFLDIPRHRSQLVDDSPISGNVRMVEKDEALKTFPLVYDRVREQTPGMFRRSEPWWRHRILRNPSRDEGGPFFKAVLEHDGSPAAYAIYQVNQKWERGVSRGSVELREVMATTPRAQRDIWKFVFGIDLVESIRSEGFFLPADHPLQLMLAQPRYLGFQLLHGLWVRVIDVKEALEARTYGSDGTISLQVRDPLFDDNDGTWRIEVSGGGATATKVSGDADVALGISELGSLYLGGYSFRQMAAADRMEVPDRAVLARADALFRTEATPWCPEIF